MKLGVKDISFVIPALNEEWYISDCIRSIQAELPGADIIVVDNGSTDQTGHMARRLGAEVILERRRGITRARQAGFELITEITLCKAQPSPYVAFIDADVILPPGWLKAAAEALEGDAIVAASGPPVYRELLFFSRALVTLFYCVGRVLHLWWPMMQGGNFIVSTKALVAIGGFNQTIDFFGEDTDTSMRLSEIGKVVFSLDMFGYFSARRLKAEGLFRSGVRYATNYIWMWLTGRPFTKTHHDYREETI